MVAEPALSAVAMQQNPLLIGMPNSPLDLAKTLAFLVRRTQSRELVLNISDASIGQSLASNFFTCLVSQIKLGIFEPPR
jgi:hypothetical protein